MHIVTQQRTSTTEHVAEQLIVLVTFKNSFIIIIFVVLLLSYVQISNYVSRLLVCYVIVRSPEEGSMRPRAITTSSGS